MISDNELFDRIRTIVAQTLRIPVEEVELDSVLTEELGAESIDFVDIVFRQEQEFKVKFFPGSAFDKLEEVLGEDVLSKNRLLTEVGVKVLHQRMPEIDPSKIYTGMPVVEINGLFTTRTWVRTVKELLDARPSACPECGSGNLTLARATLMTCDDCKSEAACPNHEEVLVQWARGFMESTTDAAK